MYDPLEASASTTILKKKHSISTYFTEELKKVPYIKLTDKRVVKTLSGMVGFNIYLSVAWYNNIITQSIDADLVSYTCMENLC